MSNEEVSKDVDECGVLEVAWQLDVRQSHKDVSSVRKDVETEQTCSDLHRLRVLTVVLPAQKGAQVQDENVENTE